MGAEFVHRNHFMPSLTALSVTLYLAPLSGAARHSLLRLAGFRGAPNSPLSHAAQRYDSSPARGGASPLSLAALAGVSPALPQGEPSVRPWF